MKTNKMLKVTGIIQSVLIGILLLFAICIEVMSRMNFYTYDYSLNFDYSSFLSISPMINNIFIIYISKKDSSGSRKHHEITTKKHFFNETSISYSS